MNACCSKKSLFAEALATTCAKPACGATSICSTKSGPSRLRNAVITQLEELLVMLPGLAVEVLRQVLQSMALRVQLNPRQHCQRF